MLNKIVQFIGIFFFGLALWLIAKEVHHLGAHHIWELLKATPLWLIGLSLAFTALDFCFLSGYDFLALSYLKQKLSKVLVVKAAFVGFAISNTTGHSYMSGGSIRFLFYVPAGLKKYKVLLLIGFESLTYLLGMAAAFLLSVLFCPFEEIFKGYRYLPFIYGAACIVFLLLVGYLYFFVKENRKIKFKKMQFTTPSFKMTRKQFLLGIGDAVSSCLAFYCILRFHLDVSFISVFTVYIIAQTAGICSQIPGGLGVFEGLFLLLFAQNSTQHVAILTSLVFFRCIYYFVPFILAAIFLLGRQSYKYFCRR